MLLSHEEHLPWEGKVSCANPGRKCKCHLIADEVRCKWWVVSVFVVTPTPSLLKSVGKFWKVQIIPAAWRRQLLCEMIFWANLNNTVRFKHKSTHQLTAMICNEGVVLGQFPRREAVRFLVSLPKDQRDIGLLPFFPLLVQDIANEEPRLCGSMTCAGQQEFWCYGTFCRGSPCHICKNCFSDGIGVIR